MHLYEVHYYEDTSPRWRRTLAAAHEEAKLSASRDEASITLRDYPSDQQTVCDLFNGQQPEGKPLRRWKLTPRGGLHEVPVGGEAAKDVIEPAPRKPRKEEPQHASEPADAFWARLTKPKGETP